MADFTFTAGGTNPTVYIYLTDASTGTSPATGLTSASAGASVYYTRPRAAATNAVIGPLTAVTSAHSDGGFIEVDATNAKGLYRLDLPDAVIAAGEDYAIVSVEFDAALERSFIIGLDPLPALSTGSVTADASNSSTAFDTTLTAANDVYNRQMIIFTTGNNLGQIDRITDYANTDGRITVGEGFTNTPAADDSFIILNQ